MSSDPVSDDTLLPEKTETPPSRASKTPAPPPLPPEAGEARKNPERCVLQYVLVQKAGAGGMGTVWKAWDTKLTRWVAVKLLNVTDEDNIRRFQREAQLAARLRHPNIASIFEVNEVGGRHFIVMEFVDGRSLEGMKRDARRAAEIVRDAARALHYAHDTGIVHRDLKPANLLERKDGQVCVTDFGMAKSQRGDSSLSVSGMVIGTPMYMPPEQATGLIREVDSRSDVYALGATLYALLTGRPPFRSENMLTVLLQVCTEDPLPPRKLEPAIPAPLEAIVLKALEKDKARRYASAALLADDLQRFLDDREVLAKPTNRTRRVFRGLRRNPWPVAATAAILLALAVPAWFLLRQKLAPAVAFPTSPKPAPSEEVWMRRFEELRELWTLRDFQARPSEEMERFRSHLATLEEKHLTSVRRWFQEQVDQLPLWEKQQWMEKQKEIPVYRLWNQTILGVLPPSFADLRSRIQEIDDLYSRIERYRGKITLSLHIAPYAELISLKVGDEVLISDGKKLSSDLTSGDLVTPLVLRDLDLGDYELVLSHPTLGSCTRTISAGKLKSGGSYVYSGEMGEPESLQLRLP